MRRDHRVTREAGCGMENPHSTNAMHGQSLSVQFRGKSDAPAKTFGNPVTWHGHCLIRGDAMGKRRILVLDADTPKSLAIVRALGDEHEVWTAANSRTALAGWSKYAS